MSPRYEGKPTDRLRAIVARWRKAGYAQTGRLGPGPAWCWLTRHGMSVTGLRYPATRPSLGRLAHIRAVLAIRLALQDSGAYRDGKAWWRCERRIRQAGGWGVPGGHVPDAEVTWPEIGHGGYAGERWAIEAELTPKPVPRTVAIMAGQLTLTDQAAQAAQGRPLRYQRVVYLVAPAARPVVDRAAVALPDRLASPLVLRDLPPGAVLLDAVDLPADARRLVAMARQRPHGRRAAAGRRPGCPRTHHRDSLARVSRRLATRLAARETAPHGRLVAAHARRLAGRAGRPRQPLACPRPGPGPRLAARLARRAGRAGAGRRRAVGPGGGPGRAGCRRRVVGVADLRGRVRAVRPHRERAGDL